MKKDIHPTGKGCVKGTEHIKQFQIGNNRN